MKLFFPITLVLLAAFLTSCKKLGLCSDDELQMEKTAYSGNGARIDGIYHASYDNGEGIVLMVFFSNGVYCTRAFNDTPMNEIESEIIDGSFNTALKNFKGSWGLYQIDGSTITTNSWKVTQGCYPNIQLEGSITNDSTLEIGNLIFKDNTVLTYHFREFQPKPDSLNSFIH